MNLVIILVLVLVVITAVGLFIWQKAQDSSFQFKYWMKKNHKIQLIGLNDGVDLEDETSIQQVLGTNQLSKMKLAYVQVLFGLFWDKVETYFGPSNITVLRWAYQGGHEDAVKGKTVRMTDAHQVIFTAQKQVGRITQKVFIAVELRRYPVIHLTMPSQDVLKPYTIGSGKDAYVMVITNLVIYTPIGAEGYNVKRDAVNMWASQSQVRYEPPKEESDVPSVTLWGTVMTEGARGGMRLELSKIDSRAYGKYIHKDMVLEYPNLQIDFQGQSHQGNGTLAMNVALELLCHKNGTNLLLIGPHNSGKTTFSHRLKLEMAPYAKPWHYNSVYEDGEPTTPFKQWVRVIEISRAEMPAFFDERGGRLRQMLAEEAEHTRNVIFLDDAYELVQKQEFREILTDYMDGAGGARINAKFVIQMTPTTNDLTNIPKDVVREGRGDFRIWLTPLGSQNVRTLAEKIKSNLSEDQTFNEGRLNELIETPPHQALLGQIYNCISPVDGTQLLATRIKEMMGTSDAESAKTSSATRPTLNLPKIQTTNKQPSSKGGAKNLPKLT